MERRSRIIALGATGTCALATIIALGASCTDSATRMREQLARRTYPPDPQPPRVITLGNLRSGKPLGDAEVQVALFLFGEEPEPPMAFIRPLSVSIDVQGLLVCDAAVGMALRWDRQTQNLGSVDISPRPSRPVAAISAADGDLLVADAGDKGAVLRFGPEGRLRLQYALDGEPCRPGGMLFVDDDLWVSNVSGHRIEVFDGATARHKRTIGRRGAGPVEFGLPLGMAATSSGNICVVDSLNNRVQVISSKGEFVAAVGGPGDLVGTFGRPKAVAAGPDGTIFVTDAASQRVHAFDAQGRPLLAFGEPGSGAGSLSIPGGICVSRECPLDDVAMPEGFEADYYVLVAEQLLRPGIRVYAWGQRRGAIGEDLSGGTSSKPRTNAQGTINPHWSAKDCRACHGQGANGGVRPILVTEVDGICLSCHDGKKARAEAHPVGRLAHTRDIQPPGDWPLNDDRLSCLTCHDVRRHCSRDAHRPVQNSVMLRVFDEEQPMALCTQCHKPADSWRTSPHKNLTADGRVNEQSCGFCHSQTPTIPADGKRTGEPHLHATSSQLCLTCHTRHWDVSPVGHVDRRTTPMIRAALASRLSPLPLSEDVVTCYSCHNPHEQGLFPSESPMGARSTLATDLHASLRISSVELCLECHAK